ncbi:hypothetical protein RvY_02809 [Ramazzottius varieornatus]|uniref:Uncharacterized protein n=1 Tax=Ramazzottius varieornatus TaxID=947166 RepID=A0A1D1UKZ5_RAMVA|nr:hypothetical protein RvY_02809 [Ramazzottius varieornatus]
MSLRCGLKPSTPPADPFGKLFTAAMTSSVATSSGSVPWFGGSENELFELSAASCFSLRTSGTCGVGAATESFKDRTRNAPLMSPSLIFPSTNILITSSGGCSCLVAWLLVSRLGIQLLCQEVILDSCCKVAFLVVLFSGLLQTCKAKSHQVALRRFGLLLSDVLYSGCPACCC